MRKPDKIITFARQRQVLTAALTCFRRKGFAATTISDICKQAKMSPGHLYHYFKSKDDIISAIAEEDRQQSTKVCLWLAEQDDLVGALIKVADVHYDAGDFKIDGRLAFEIYAEASRNRRIKTALYKNSSSVQKELAAQIQKAQACGIIDIELDAAGAAILITAVFEGLSVAGLCNPDFDPVAVGRVLPLLFRRFFQPQLAKATFKDKPIEARTLRNTSASRISEKPA